MVPFIAQLTTSPLEFCRRMRIFRSVVEALVLADAQRRA
jgi:hypothetical protein